MPALEMAEPEVEASGTTPDPVETPSPAPAETQESADDALTPDAETAPPSEAPARDDQGRFTKADGTLSEPGEEPAPEGTEPEPTLEDYASFTYRAANQELEFAGAVKDDEGNVLFTPEAVQRLQQKLAYAEAYPIRDAQAQRDVATERTAREAAETTVQSVLGKLEQMFEASQGAATWEEFAQTPLGQWIANRYTEWPKLKAEGIQKGADVRTKALEAEVNQFRSQQYEADLRPQMLSQVSEAVQHWGKEAGFTEQEQQRLVRKYSADWALNVIFPRADRDDPVRGLRVGQRSANLDAIRLDMLEMYELLKNRTPAQNAATVAAENARRTGQAGQKAPPTPGVGRGSKPAAEKSKKYTNTREADSDIWG